MTRTSAMANAVKLAPTILSVKRRLSYIVPHVKSKQTLTLSNGVVWESISHRPEYDGRNQPEEKVTCPEHGRFRTTTQK